MAFRTGCDHGRLRGSSKTSEIVVSEPLQIGLVIFPRVTQLDFTGPLQVFSSMPGAKVHLIWKRIEPVASDKTTRSQAYDEAESHIVCPWHGYEFSIRSGFHQGNSRVRLRKAELAIRDGEIYVSV